MKTKLLLLSFYLKKTRMNFENKIWNQGYLLTYWDLFVCQILQFYQEQHLLEIL